jgi:FkbM family methyltransferase
MISAWAALDESMTLDGGPNRELAAALADREAFRAMSRLRRLLRRPLSGTAVLLFRRFPWIPPVRVRARLFTGQSLSVILPELLSREVYLHGFFEAPLTRMLLALLRPGMVFADVGAQYGYYSMLAHRLVGPAGRVFAFEPAPHTYSVLRDNVAGLENVVAENVAVYSTAGVVGIHDFGPAHSGLNSLLPQPRVGPDEASRLRPKRIEIRSVRLDDYFAEQGVAPDFVKIDVESMELHVLKSMETLLRDARPAVSVEIGDLEVSGASESRESVRFLLDRGYRCLEYREGRLVRHRERTRYEHDNLLFVPVA